MLPKLQRTSQSAVDPHGSSTTSLVLWATQGRDNEGEVLERDASFVQCWRKFLPNPFPSTMFNFPEAFLAVVRPHRDIGDLLGLGGGTTTWPVGEAWAGAGGDEHPLIRTSNLALRQLNIGNNSKGNASSDSELSDSKLPVLDPEMPSVRTKRHDPALVVTFHRKDDLRLSWPSPFAHLSGLPDQAPQAA